MRVLQVEDDAAAAKAVERMLESNGHACQTTAFGEKAVELAQRNAYDLILLDVMLPDIDGFEVLRRLQTARVKTPVVVQSGYMGRVDLTQNVCDVVKDYLIKPYTRQELSERLDAAIGKEQSKPAAAGRAVEEASERHGTEDDDMRRKYHRMRTLKSAQIIYNNANCVADCLVVNISGGGARLKASDIVDFPEIFLLKIRGGPTYRCQLSWQHGKELGVQFLGR